MLASPGMPTAEFCSEEGVQQGDAVAGVSFCGGVHPEVCALDEQLRAHGGAARFQMDDGYAMGPSGAVFPAVLAFAQSMRGLGLELQLDKCFCYCLREG